VRHNGGFVMNTRKMNKLSYTTCLIAYQWFVVSAPKSQLFFLLQMMPTMLQTRVTRDLMR
jgi:hypothetical protein